MSQKLDLSSVSTDDLLRDLEGRAPAKVNLVETWLSTAGYYPGQTKIRAQELWEIFNDWYRVRPELHDTPLPTLIDWGIQMTARFKKGRSKAGNFYYMSRKRDIDPPSE